MADNDQRIGSNNSSSGSVNLDAPMKDVGGKVAFITGGDSGIGLGIAQACADAGMKIIITYRSKEHLDHAMTVLAAAGDRVRAICIDVTDRTGMVAAAAETIRLFGKIHVLINNAGVGPTVPLSSATFDDWDWCMNVNVNGVFNGIHAFLPHIRAHGEGGQIVATASMLGGLVVGPYWGVYSTSKFAVVGMMEALRSELANTRIGVSVFCPAGVSSKIGQSARNRPPSLAQKGAADPEISPLIEAFNAGIRGVMRDNGGSPPMMDPLEAGRHVLRGIRNNDLYILSHGEYEQALRDRNDALLASLPHFDRAVPEVRKGIAKLARNPIYINELKRKSKSATPE